jgi:23S rRNA pseudouridine2605 synthase
LRKGITVEGERFQPMEVALDRQQGANAWLTIGLREGKNREIRRAMEAVGLSVNRLIRVSYGPFQLEDLKPGAVEELRRKVVRDQLGLEIADPSGTAQKRPTKVRRGPPRKRVKSGEIGGPGQPGRPKPPEEGKAKDGRIVKKRPNPTGRRSTQKPRR